MPKWRQDVATSTEDLVFLGDVQQKVMHKLLVLTAVAVVDSLWQFVSSLAHVHILLMDTIKTIDKTVVYKAQEKRKEFIINLFEKEDVGCVHEF
jgi:hypothetical protein